MKRATSAAGTSVTLTVRGPLRPPWAGRVSVAVQDLARAVADRAWADRFCDLAGGLRFRHYQASNPAAAMSAMYFPNEGEVVILDRALDVPSSNDQKLWMVLGGVGVMGRTFPGKI